MDTFEDDNPFQDVVSDDVVVPSETSSTSKMDLSEPQSPQSASNIPQTPKPTLPGLQNQLQNTVKSDFCCARDRDIHSGEDFEILITDAQKTSVNASSPYIVYIIKTGNSEAHHRYSEFESLRLNLAKLYPTLIIPPIPSKQTIGDYAVKQAKAKEDAAMIARRKRMLQMFLNRLARHPIVSSDHVFHRFLDGHVSWTEILNSPPISLLPKNVLKAPSENPTDPNASPAYAALPSPSSSHPLRTPDQRFLDSEAFTLKFANHLSGPMEKVSRRTLKRWSDSTQDHHELGAALNGFSLNESGTLSAALERTGQAVDVTYMSNAKLVQELEQTWTEPLHEYSQFASIIKKLLGYRHQKHVQYEMTQDGLVSKREQLEELERSEREAKRLESALSRGRPGIGQSNSAGAESGEAREGEEIRNDGEVRDDGEVREGGEAEGNAIEEDVPERMSASLPPHPGPRPTRRKLKPPGMGFLNALSYTLQGMMDVDPETARRNSITKTKETITSLEDALRLSAQDLKYSSTTIQADLDRFQRQKVADFRDMAINLARAHRDWCKKNLEAWEDAKKEIEKIPEHPNKAPSETPIDTPPAAAMQGPTMSPNKRDSSATLNGR